jgi:hypothetical protein
MRAIDTYTLSLAQLRHHYGELMPGQEPPAGGKRELARTLNKLLADRSLYIGVDGKVHRYRLTYPEKFRIFLKVPNPKRAGSKRRDLFEKYQNGMTVGEYIDRVGRKGTMRVIRKDVQQGFIEVRGENDNQHA